MSRLSRRYCTAYLSTPEVISLLTGLNHLTLAVTNLPRSVEFYHDLLQLRLDATWDTGAYLSLPGLWLCLSLDPLRNTEPAADYTHYAFSLSASDFSGFVERLRAANVEEWRDNAAKARLSIFLTRTAISSKPMSAIWRRGWPPVDKSPIRA
jgi:catechol 2,3-dioxygenase-like lactoylglutathione lyase family enzyme